VTSRDTTAAGFAMEVGLSPRRVDKIVMVIRTFPIRVGGTSGPFRDEITWDDVRTLSGAPETYPEYTSVTKRLRRVAKFNLDQVKVACEYNKPTSIAVMGLDRLDYANTNVNDADILSCDAKRFIMELELATETPVDYAGTGFGTFDVVRLKIAKSERFDFHG
jgi:adenylosuccinate synthase